MAGTRETVAPYQRWPLVERLGAELAESGRLAAAALAVDGMYGASVPGLYAAGEVGVQMPSLASTIASGPPAAAVVVGDLGGALPAGTV